MQLIVALFITAREWSQPIHPSTQEGSENVVHIHNGILCSHKERQNHDICRKVDAVGTHMSSKINQIKKDKD